MGGGGLPLTDLQEIQHDECVCGVWGGGCVYVCVCGVCVGCGEVCVCMGGDSSIQQVEGGSSTPTPTSACAVSPGVQGRSINTTVWLLVRVMPVLPTP